MSNPSAFINMKAIGWVNTETVEIPRHWSRSDVKGKLIIEKKYMKGLRDIRAGQRIVVIFHFHRSPVFSMDRLVQTPPHQDESRGVFSICSPVRPNPLGMSVLEVIGIEDNIITVRGIDMIDGTPILDIKPYIE